MATSKTLTPTNETISIPAMTDQPDASVFSNCIDKEADAINTLNSQIANLSIVQEYASSPATKTFTLASGGCYMVVIDKLNAGDAGTACGMYMVQAHSGVSALRTIAQSAALSAITVDKLTLTITTSANYVGIAVIRLAQW